MSKGVLKDSPSRIFGTERDPAAAPDGRTVHKVRREVPGPPDDDPKTSPPDNCRNAVEKRQSVKCPRLLRLLKTLGSDNSYKDQRNRHETRVFEVEANVRHQGQ